VPQFFGEWKLVNVPSVPTFFQYHLAHSARAELCRSLGRIPEARASYEKALGLAAQEADRRFLTRRIEELK